LPTAAVLFTGRRIGDLLYRLDARHRAIAHANIKFALGNGSAPCRIKNITREFYRGFGQSIIEIFIIPRVDRKFIDKYIKIEGYEYVEKAFKSGKGVIFAGVHEGSWELYNIICKSVMGFGFSLFVRQQDKFPRLNCLLNSFRKNQGCQIIEKQNQTRQLIELLEAGKPIGMSVDQGGKDGVSVEFFGRDASMASGAVRLALKYDAIILPAFYTRAKGLKGKIIVKPPLEISKTGDSQEDLRNALQKLVLVFEGLIREYPQEYLWTYKIWKYSKSRKILVLSDGKAGHLRQAQALAQIVSRYFREKGIAAGHEVAEVNFKNRFFRAGLSLCGCLTGRYSCQGCLRCLKVSLRQDSYRLLSFAKVDIVISCGSSLAAVNYLFCRENLSKSFVLMKPSFLSLRKFDLLVMPMHDNPPRRKNVVATQGALNLIDKDYLNLQAARLSIRQGIERDRFNFYIGILIGGEAKDFRLDTEKVSQVINQAKLAAERNNAGILVTSSRRTLKETEILLKREFSNYPRCKLLIIANEKNIPGAVAGILGLSKFAIVSPESISMISEAASSGREVIVFEDRVGVKHKRFLGRLSRDKHIYLCGSDKIGDLIAGRKEGPCGLLPLNDAEVIKKALGRIL